ncbi:hypothetical protein GIB67_038421, partial [Kingdonia uniflora]
TPLETNTDNSNTTINMASSTHLPYLWVIETLTENKNIPTSQIHDLMRRSNVPDSDFDDPWVEFTKERLALRQLEDLLGVFSSNVDTQIEGVDLNVGGEVEFDVSETPQVVLARILEKIPTSNRSMSLREDLRHFILLKRSSLPTCALQQLEDTTLKGGQLSAAFLRGWSEAERENQDISTIVPCGDAIASFERPVKFTSEENREDPEDSRRLVDCGDTVTTFERPEKFSEVNREYQDNQILNCGRNDATVAIESIEKRKSGIDREDQEDIRISIDGGAAIATFERPGKLISEVDRDDQEDSRILVNCCSDDAFVAIERLENLTSGVDGEDREDMRTSVGGGNDAATFERAENLTSQLDREDQEDNIILVNCCTDDAFLATDRLEKLPGAMDREDRDDIRTSVDGGDDISAFERPQKLTCEVDREDQEASHDAVTAVKKPDQRAKDVEIGQSNEDSTTTAPVNGENFSVCENVSQNVKDGETHLENEKSTLNMDKIVQETPDSILAYRKRKRRGYIEEKQVGCSDSVRIWESGSDFHPLTKSMGQNPLHVFKLLGDSCGRAEKESNNVEKSALPKHQPENVTFEDDGDDHTYVTSKKMKNTENGCAIQHKESLFPSNKYETRQEETMDLLHQKKHVTEAKHVSENRNKQEASRAIDDNLGNDPSFGSDEDMVIATEKRNFLSSQNHINQDSQASVDYSWTEQSVCIKCNKDGQLLICSVSNCPITVHENCVDSSTSFDNTGNFCCPFCSLTQATGVYREAKKKAEMVKKKRVLARKYLHQFMQMVNENQQKHFRGIVSMEIEIDQATETEREEVLGCHEDNESQEPTIVHGNVDKERPGPLESTEVEIDLGTGIEQEEVVGYHEGNEPQEPTISHGNVDKERLGPLEPIQVEIAQVTEIDQEEVVECHEDNEFQEPTISHGNVDQERLQPLEPLVIQGRDDQ